MPSVMTTVPGHVPWLPPPHISDATDAEDGLRTTLRGLVEILRPALVVETGAYYGMTTRVLGEACRSNEFGCVISCEPNPKYREYARALCAGLPVEVRAGMSADVPELSDADFLFLDSDYKYRADEIARAKRGATIVIHDAYKSYDPTIEPLAPLIESLGGITFRCGIDGRGFGILVKR